MCTCVRCCVNTWMSERNGIINNIVGWNEMYVIISNIVGLNEIYDKMS